MNFRRVSFMSEYYNGTTQSTVEAAKKLTTHYEKRELNLRIRTI